MHEHMTFPWEVEEVSLRTTTVRGVHGINYLERHDEDPRFATDEEAQEYTRKALESHDDLVDALLRILRAHKSGNNGAYNGEAVLCKSFECQAEAALKKAGVEVPT